MAIYYCTAAVSNANVNAIGTAGVIGSPFGIQGALNTMTNADDLYLVADADYTVPAGGFDDPRLHSTALGSVKKITGCDASGNITGVRAVLDGSSALTSQLWNNNTADPWGIFNWVDFRGPDDGSSICINTSQVSERFYFNYCKFDGFHDVAQIRTRTGSQPIIFNRCQFTNSDNILTENAGNTGISFRNQNTKIIGCLIDGASYGFLMSSGSGIQIIQGNIFKDITGAAIDFDDGDRNQNIIEKNIFYNCGSGIRFENPLAATYGEPHIQNNSFVNCTTGIESTDAGEFAQIHYNHFHNNTNDISSGSALSKGVGNITGDPLFTDPSTNDFSLGTGSPLIGAGMPVGGPA